MNILNVLDTITLTIVYILVHLAITITFVIASRVYKDKFMNILTIAFILSSIGASIVLLQAIATPFVGIIISNFLLVLGTYIVAKGLLDILGLEFKNKFISILISIHSVLFLYFTYIDANVNARVIIFTIEHVIPAIIIAYFYLKRYRADKEITKLSMGILYILYSAILLFRTSLAITAKENIKVLNGEMAIKLLLLYTILFMMIRALVIILIVAKNLQGKLICTNDELEKLSHIDHLTNIYNKRAILEHLAEETSRIDRYVSVTTIAMIDLDYFKMVNDTYGHVFGDEVLRTFSKLAKEEIRTIDKIGRYGGEEFLLVMPETDAEGASVLLNRLKDRFKSVKWSTNSKSISFSVGLIEIVKSNVEIEDRTLIDRADKALYKAKEKGRDRIEIYIEGI